MRRELAGLIEPQRAVVDELANGQRQSLVTPLVVLLELWHQLATRLREEAALEETSRNRTLVLQLRTRSRSNTPAMATRRNSGHI